ncbi:hypothetical protein SHJG_1942 [Streptomyces hygroscopicus subsp. jinggangensis 5008]|nr:hypothetical protein SHJG_1942 [Streptomyces hygroscopicus subsp. jinggangensis 5008]AGF61373.1 hypothetical protein SHJGH_1707 [Streptomyces hygroscopicus subsp. jinggangensis TL01]
MFPAQGVGQHAVTRPTGRRPPERRARPADPPAGPRARGRPGWVPHRAAAA